MGLWNSLAVCAIKYGIGELNITCIKASSGESPPQLKVVQQNINFFLLHRKDY